MVMISPWERPAGIAKWKVVEPIVLEIWTRPELSGSEAVVKCPRWIVRSLE